MNVVLCGMMGCGKTTVAAEVSSRYNLTSVDTDAEIVKEYGEINAIFSEYGEEYFRTIEAKTVAAVAKKYKNAVISTGGGCVLRAENVCNLKATGKIIYLRTQPETLIKRVEGDTSRPLLKGGAKDKIYSILSVRAPVYTAAADYIVDTDGLTPEQIATKIMELVK
ncbi:MAG: shikimate kinase [Candidatus Coproplasma sp.]